MSKVALITGYTGQDGTFLTRYLLSLGYTVVALCRRISTEPPHRVRGFDFSDEIASGRLILEQGDLLSVSSLMRIIKKHQPHEVYNLAAQSHVATSFNQPEFTIEADLLGVVNLITAMESARDSNNWKMYQASTSEMFGDVTPTVSLDPMHNDPQPVSLNENTRLNPNSPYAIAKTAAHHYCRMKRHQGYFIANGILFNHESEIRGGDFVTQKIVRGVVDFVNKGGVAPGSNAGVLELGNLNSVRDWGYAQDYVMGMHMMLQHDLADDFVLATGSSHSVRNFVEAAIEALGCGWSVRWEGKGTEEKGYINDRLFVSVNPEYYRPNDVNYLSGDATKAKNELGWWPITSFNDMVKKMVDAQMSQSLNKKG